MPRASHSARSDGRPSPAVVLAETVTAAATPAGGSLPLPSSPRLAPRRPPAGADARGRLRRGLTLLGPAFVAAVAYVDPGNFATNLMGGARFGYALVWVVVMANGMAVVVQYLSAKVGIASGCSLPELCREAFPHAANVFLWIEAEAVAIATDLAEFIGAAIGLHLLLRIALFPAGVITAVVAFGILGLEQRGRRRFELAIVALLSLVALGLAYDLVAVGHLSLAAAGGGLTPGLAGPGSLLMAIGIIGATVMPHAVYVHSALTRRHTPPATDRDRRRLLRFTRIDCGLAFGMAGLINIVMLVVAASLFHRVGHTDIATIAAAHADITVLVGAAAGLAFAVALLASGVSSSSVGTYAGQVAMEGFIRRSIPLFVRRAVTMAPALTLLALGLPATQTLVLSQVALSFGIPFALVPLVVVTSRRDLMGALVNRRATTALACVIAAVIIALNACLLQGTVWA